MSFLEDCKRTEAPINQDTRLRLTEHARTLHHLVGLQTEVGELVDAFKKCIYYGQPLDRVNVVEEIGDIEYYLELLCDSLQIRRDGARLRVVAKLRERYPDRFTQKDAIDRDLSAERSALRSPE